MPEQLSLELEPLRRGLDHQLGVGEVLERGRGDEPGDGLRGLLGAQAAALDASVELGLDPLHPALERLRCRVVQERPRAGQAGQLGNARAHRAGARDSDRLAGPASALTPARAR